MSFKNNVLVFFLALLIIGLGCSKDSQKKYELSVSVTPETAGSTSPSTGIFDAGEEVSVFAIPSEGFHFEKWSGFVQSRENPIMIKMNSDTELTAFFLKDDTDNDGVNDDLDECPSTPVGETVNNQGCSDSQLDEDQDGVMDSDDICANTLISALVDENGCSENQKDSDNDGVSDDIDQCPGTPSESTVNEFGCLESEADGDNDGIENDSDNCPNTPTGEAVDINGCSLSQKDSDGDGISDDIDECAETPDNAEVNDLGCAISQIDTDEDGVYDDVDECPDTPFSQMVNEKGCSPSQTDKDEDGVSDSEDSCPETPSGETVDISGCSESQNDKNAPTILGYEVSEVGSTSFKVDWNLDEESKGYIRFGTASGVYVATTNIENNYLSRHIQTVGGNNPFPLNPNTTYYWQIFVEDKYGNSSYSQEYSTTTLEIPIQRPFIFTNEEIGWGGPGNSYMVKIPTDPNLGYNYTVDWGDGNIDTNVTGDIWHTYANEPPNPPPGPYEIKITGVFPRIYFGNDLQFGRRHTTTVIQWGDHPWVTMENAFTVDAIRVTATDVPDLSNCTSLRNMFANSFFYINESIKNWDVSHISDLSGMFKATKFNQDISSWNVSNVTNMSELFSGGIVLVGLGVSEESSVFNQNISNWDVSNVTDMSRMFYASDFDRDISNWDVSKVTDMSGMFQGSLFNKDISNWDVSNVSNMSDMFNGRDYIRVLPNGPIFNQDLSGWNVGKVTNMSNMFAYTKVFNQNLSSWDVADVIECKDFSLEATSWTLPKPNFDNCDPN